MSKAELTRRERQVAEMIAMGKRTVEIAKELRIGVKTVSTHRDNLLKKLGLPNNVLLARHAISVGWVPMPPLGN